jgi:hypothetical protein
VLIAKGIRKGPDGGKISVSGRKILSALNIQNAVLKISSKYLHRVYISLQKGRNSTKKK